MTQATPTDVVTLSTALVAEGSVITRQDGTQVVYNGNGSIPPGLVFEEAGDQPNDISTDMSAISLEESFYGYVFLNGPTWIQCC